MEETITGIDGCCACAASGHAAEMLASFEGPRVGNALILTKETLRSGHRRGKFDTPGDRVVAARVPSLLRKPGWCMLRMNSDEGPHGT
jgi:hypothetical protein